MAAPFENINFLTRSENRVEVLATLAEAARTERELVEATGISDVTAGRILEDFVDRGWAREVDGGYETTSLGEMLSDDYERLEASMHVACRLGPTLEYLPVDAMEFDFRHLTDARLSNPDRHDVLRAVDRWMTLVHDADHVRALSSMSVATVAEALNEAVLEDGMRYEAVYDDAALDGIRSRPDLAGLHREMADAGADLYHADGGMTVPNSVALFDDLVGIAGFDDSGALRVGIESQSAAVREWARDTFADRRNGATLLAPEDFET